MEIGGARPEVHPSLIAKIYNSFSDGLHFATPISSLRTNEIDLVRSVLQVLQGFSSSLLYWDQSGNCFRPKSGIYVTHLSQTSLHVVLNQFLYSATCLKLVEIVVSKVERALVLSPPTLRAFASSVSAWLQRLRDIALKEETKIYDPNIGTTPTLLGLANSLSSLCSGSEYLLQIVNGAIPQECFESNSSTVASEITVHVLDYLFKKLDEVSLVQGGEEESYQMLLHIFVGSLLPYIEGLDSWLFEGILEDPFEEMFFYANKEISVDETEFWEKSYLLRVIQPRKLDADLSARATSSSRAPLSKNMKQTGEKACPLFITDIAKSIVSAGKSLQLIRHVPTTLSAVCRKGSDDETDGFGTSKNDSGLCNIHHWQSIAGLTLSEVFCVSLAGLIGHGDHISRYFWQDDHSKSEVAPGIEFYVEKVNGETFPSTCSEKIWYKLLVETLSQKRLIDIEPSSKDARNYADANKQNMTASAADKLPQGSFFPQNPAITVCQTFLNKNRDTWNSLNLARSFSLPPLNDEVLRRAIFNGENMPFFEDKGTNFALGFQFDEFEHLRSQADKKLLEGLFPFPTVLPSFQDNLHMSELLPSQKNSTLHSQVLTWIKNTESRTTPLPVVIMQECLIVYIKKQVDYVGRHILSKLMIDWKLMDELATLRAIYLLGSGDLLHHFLTVIFNKLDKGETWDDDFELNTILQESISNSADRMILSAPDSLVVSLTKSLDEQQNQGSLPSTPRKGHTHIFGIDALDSLKFTYKVSWPLELIANIEAIKKYNQVMGFLLKVKRAKYALDKARRWMWKGGGMTVSNRKHHWLVEQKLLHFVDAFHQYVMDRVYHSAWRELCEGMAAAGSLDEVIEVHEAYLVSIQRQCFVVPDKLGSLIARRVKEILELSLKFYSIQQTLNSGGAVSGVKSRCETEVSNIEKKFDDCIAYLLRVLSFKLNVGHFPHLADLVTRINYNYFYMSDTGNLATAPSRPAKGRPSPPT